MTRLGEPRISVTGGLRDWWRDQRERAGSLVTLRTLATEAWQFLRDSTGGRRRARYGDIDYDWEHRVDTTGATVGWRTRFLGMLHSAYQPTDPDLFRQMIEGLGIDYSEFTFIDLGSGKGRTLLMASDYPFRRIVGVELLPELNSIAQENIRNYRNPRQQCFKIESRSADARDFVFPPEPTVLYLFNPLPESGLRQVMANLAAALRANGQRVYLVYHNPLLEAVVEASELLRKTAATEPYSVFTNETVRPGLGANPNPHRQC